MSRTKDLWQEQHEAAIERFVTGEDDAALFATALRKLGFSSADIQHEINNTIAERAEQAAYEAEIAHYGRGQ
jgi:Holliday junction resolvasome RuvABC DNA-binding subunit